MNVLPTEGADRAPSQPTAELHNWSIGVRVYDPSSQEVLQATVTTAYEGSTHGVAALILPDGRRGRWEWYQAMEPLPVLLGRAFEAGLAAAKAKPEAEGTNGYGHKCFEKRTHVWWPEHDFDADGICRRCAEVEVES